MKILFMGPNPTDPKRNGGESHSQQLVRSYAAPGTEIDFASPDDYVGAHVLVKIAGESALPGLHHVISTTNFIRKVAWAEANGYDAATMPNPFDPGVEAARLAVKIPVIGVQRVALHTATVLAGRIALTVPFQSHVYETWKIVRSYGMENFVKDIRPIGMYPGNMGTSDNLKNATIQVMKDQIAACSPEYIVPLGGALIPYVVDPKELEAAVGVPVLNTKVAAIKFAEMCVNFGMSQSNVAYPRVGSITPEDFNMPAFS